MGSIARKIGWGLLVVVLLCAAGAGAAVWWVRDGIRPTPKTETFYYRVDSPKLMAVVLEELSRKGVVRDSRAIRYYARWKRAPSDVREGTYELHGGLTADEIFQKLREPVRQMVRLPETMFSFRLAPILGETEVGEPGEYLSLMQQPQEFAGVVSFKLPEDSLEGYLFPDTYDLPPLIGARAVIERQLRAFESKAQPLLEGKDARRTLTIASMVELEAQKDSERAIIAGVIENRLKKKMRLQIDATVLYGLREWRRLTYADYQAESPYNTYKIDGLPPGPICSPSLRSIEAAVKPAKHNYLYYVALPDGGHQFSETYAQHLRYLAERRKRMARG